MRQEQSLSVQGSKASTPPLAEERINAEDASTPATETVRGASGLPHVAGGRPTDGLLHVLVIGAYGPCAVVADASHSSPDRSD